MKKITLILFMMFTSFLGYSQFHEDFEGTSLPNNTTGVWSMTTTTAQGFGAWRIADNGIGTAQSWGVNTIAANVYAGTRSAYLNREGVTAGALAEDRLITPSITIPTNGQLRFWTKQTLAGVQGSTYSIQISTTSQTAGFTTLQTWNEDELNVTYNVYEEKIVAIPAAYWNLTTPVYIAFVMTNNNGDRWLIDNVNVVEQCLDPTTQTATNPTLTGATLGWNNPSGASSWEVEIVATGVTPTGTGTVVASNPYTPTNLTQGTCYDFYVRALCTTGAKSEWIGPFNFCTVSLGATCGAPIQIPSLATGPYITTNNTNGFGDDYNGSPGATGCGTTQPYLNGDDVFYSFTATSTNQVMITSQTNSNWSGLFVYSGCANVGVSCVAGTNGGNGTTTPDSVMFTQVLGQTYYIVISTLAPPQSVPYTLVVKEVTCTNMAATFAVVSNCASTTDPNTFFVNATVSNMGSATAIAGTSTPASPTTVPNITAPGVMQFGPFLNGTNVTVNLQNANDPNCFINSTSLTQAFCPATNDLCANAIPITCTGGTITQTTVGATSTGAPTGTCGTTGGSGGLWYSFAGNGDVVTFSLCGSAYDTKIQVVTGNCGAFTCVTGNDDFAGCGLQSQVQVTTAVGTLYYIYVYGFGTAQGVFTLNTTCITPPPPPANDNCDTATNVPVNIDGTCTQLAAGTVVGATPSSQVNGCVGTADDDVWFSFTATQAVHIVNIQDITGSTSDLNHAIYTSTNATNPCGNLTQIICSDPNQSIAGTFVVGQVYYIRVYTAIATPLQTTNFNVCVSVPPPPPANDSCATPTVAPVNSTVLCTTTVPGTITSATASPEPNACTGTADDDVWFQFTALQNLHSISLNNIVGTTQDLAFAVYSGASCGALTQINCQTNNNGLVGGLTPGVVYYIRVYSQPNTPYLLANFDLCITTPTQCSNAQTSCGDGTPIQNQINVPSYGTIGCLGTTPNPFWFNIEIETSGPITFTLNQTSAGNSDVDFILWGPFTTAQINSNACNNLYGYPAGNNGVPNNVIDCSYSAAATEFVDIPNAIAGQHYILLVTNYGNSLGNFNLNQTSGTGAAACCSVELGPDVTLCDQTSYTITATVTSADSFKWYKDNVLIIGQTTANLTVTQTGTYKCEITCGQITKTDEVVVTFNTPTTPTFNTIPTNICINGTAPTLPQTSTNTTSIAGTWNPSAIDTSVATTAPVEYVFTPAAGQCATTFSTFVSIDALTTPTFTGLPASICKGATPPALLTSSANTIAITGTWNPTTIDTSVATTTPAQYVFTPTAGQCADSYTYSVSILPTPDVTATPSTSSICSGATTNLMLTSSLVGTTYSWTVVQTGVSGAVSGTGSSIADVLTTTGNTNGTAVYTITPSNNGCVGTSIDVTVTVLALPATATIATNSPICSGTNAQFTITGTPGATVTYSLNGATAQTVGLNASGTAIVNQASATANVVLNISNVAVGTCNNTTPTSATVTVTALPSIATLTNNSPICSGSNAQFTITGTPNATVTYSLNTGATQTVVLNASGTATINQANATSNVTLNLASINSNGCNVVLSNTATVLVVAKPVAQVIANAFVCKGSSYTLPTLNAGNAYYTNSNGTGTPLTGSVVINTTQTIYVYAAGTVANCSDVSSFTITAVDLPVVTLTGGCSNNVYTINASVSPSGSTTSYIWTGPSGSLAATGSSITASQDGQYTCVAKVTSANNTQCVSTATVFAANGTLCTIQKGISPNGDGLNDSFDLTGLNVRKLEIFNRYGKKVYSYSNYVNQWYGQSDKGDELPVGTYYFVIERDNVNTESGWIYINR